MPFDQSSELQNKMNVISLIFGRRGMGKISLLILPLTVCVGPDMQRLPSVLFILLGIICWSQVCHLVNDLADNSQDQNNKTLITLAIVFLTAGVTAISFTFRIKVLLVYTASILLGIFYSIKPLRFKVRGIWGIVSYSLSCALAYVLVPAEAFDLKPGSLVVCLFLAVFFDKSVNLLYHQIMDYPNDLREAFPTFAVQSGLPFSRRILSVASWLAFFLMSAAYFETARTLSHGMIKSSLVLFSVIVFISVYFFGVCCRKTKMISLFNELNTFYLSATLILFRVTPVFVLALLFQMNVLYIAYGFMALIILLLEIYHCGLSFFRFSIDR